MFCSNCGKEVDDKAIVCVHCGCAVNKKEAKLPKELKGFNYGAFFWTWIWGLFNKTYIALLAILFGLLALIPFGWGFPLVFAIWLGSVGNELAWKNKEWDDIEHFKRVQNAWGNWGAVLFVGIPAIVIIFFVLIQK